MRLRRQSLEQNWHQFTALKLPSITMNEPFIEMLCAESKLVCIQSGSEHPNDRSMHMPFSKRVSIRVIALVFFCVLFLTGSASAQSVASGTIEGTVVDPTGGAVVGANVEIRNPITGFERTAVTDSAGVFRFTNIPFNPYHVQVSKEGFAPAAQDVNVRSTVPIPVRIPLSVAGVTQSVTLDARLPDIVENVPYAHAVPAI